MSQTVIPSDKRQEKRMANPGKNEKFVGSREGGPREHAMTKNASIKHENPEYFKRQADRKSHDSLDKFKKDQSGFQEKQMSKGCVY